MSKKTAICALLLGREGSVGFHGKNTFPVLERPLMRYPMMSAENSRYITHKFFSTDSEAYKETGRKNGWEIIDRPPELATDTALGEDAILHAYKKIVEHLNGLEIEAIAQLFCNAATVLSSYIDRGVEMLRADPKADSVVTVSVYNMWSPLRARRLNNAGFLKPFVPFETFGDLKTLNCDRDSQGDVFFADMGLNLVRPRCIDNIENGILPQKWMGQKILPLKQWGGLDVDYEWQVPHLEFWLKEHGFTETQTPYD